MRRDKQIEEMANKSTHTTERKRRGEYVRRIVDAVKNRGCKHDHEDVWSVLYDFEEEITKGYRKASEIFEEISQKFSSLYGEIQRNLYINAKVNRDDGPPSQYLLGRVSAFKEIGNMITELQKKYAESNGGN